MAEYMQNYNLKKPAEDDFFNVNNFNENADIIDQELKAHDDAINEHLNDGTQHKKTARFTIGTTQSGWVAEDVDYLCTGTNDQVQINNALNALPADGGEIVILDGTYNIEGAIHIAKDNTTLRGSGNATLLKRMYNSTATDEGNTARGLITLNGKEGCRIKDLYIDGNRDNYDSPSNYGICMISSSDNAITGNVCSDNSHYGIRLDSSSNNNTITGNTCNNNGYGIYLYSSSDNNTVTGNICNNNYDDGIHLNFSSNNTITGNTCKNNYRGIYLTSSSNNNTITSNTCNNNERTGIDLSFSNNNTTTGNICSDNSDYGIFLTSSSNNAVTGNTCNNNSDNGIYLGFSCNYNCIVGNVLVDNGTAYSGGGTGNVEANNVKK